MVLRIALSIVVLTVVLPLGSAFADDESTDVAVTEHKGDVAVRILDPNVSPRAISAALKGTGLDVAVAAKPVSPSLVGEWIGGGSPHWNVTLEINPHDGTRALIRRTDRHVLLYVGRRARHNEPYFAARDPFCRDEPLAGTGIEDLDPSLAAREMEQLGIGVSWRLETTTLVEPGHTAGTSTIVAAPPNGVITHAIAVSPASAIVFVAPPGDYAAQHRDLSGGC